MFSPSKNRLPRTGTVNSHMPSARITVVCTKPMPSMPIYFWDDEDGEKGEKAAAYARRSGDLRLLAHYHLTDKDIVYGVHFHGGPRTKLTLAKNGTYTADKPGNKHEQGKFSASATAKTLTLKPVANPGVEFSFERLP